ncbi:class I SAM-dependent methyltransferase [Algoriphagus machipongonensis]|uniref:O-methyltransferase I n=1 Tax=Algoriphagus machipongonensis TaxID=388413 RepID=A3I1Y6_9BACT|nr:O-methyltransferase [Algoriphagus machipongonensis]EAZ79802.1 O-methyltransferase I [Algoriphagus machipongonensis]
MLGKIRAWVESLPFDRQRRIKRRVNYFRSIGKSSDLDYLAQLFQTDKFGKHFYTPNYKLHLQHLRGKSFNMLEIGVGGYDNPHQGGGSLRMWKRFFSKAKIHAIDIFDKSALNESRIKIFQGSQVDLEFLDKVCDEIGEIEVIVDDGSHINEHVITTFKHLFPKLKLGGIYVVEDTQTSYWEEYGGKVTELNDPETINGFFKRFVDNLNYKEFPIADYEADYYTKHIVSIHFYHNMIFIYKGLNDEPSNISSVS